MTEIHDEKERTTVMTDTGRIDASIGVARNLRTENGLVNIGVDMTRKKTATGRLEGVVSIDPILDRGVVRRGGTGIHILASITVTTGDVLPRHGRGQDLPDRGKVEGKDTVNAVVGTIPVSVNRLGNIPPLAKKCRLNMHRIGISKVGMIQTHWRI